MDIKAWTSCSLVFCIVGSVFDIYTIVVLVRDKQFRRSHYILLLGAVITDCACNCIFIPIETIQTHHLISYHVPWGNKLFCIIENYFFAIVFNSSVLCQDLIALNRVLAVYAPIFYQRRINVKVALIEWVSVSIAFPALYHGFALAFGWMVYDIDYVAGDCQAQKEKPIANLFRRIIFVYTPLAFSLSAYMTIVVRIIITKSAEKRSTILKRAKGSMAMFAGMLFYTVCLVPLWSVTRDNLWLFLWMKFLFRSSYAMNPVRNYLISDFIHDYRIITI